MSQDSSKSEENFPKLQVNNLFDLAEGSDWKVSLSNENPLDRTIDYNKIVMMLNIVVGALLFYSWLF